ncbi:MAG TPA: hypothetical protein VFN10_23595 [Thermoanaerobaculia bacterium]|nr:hypothetical protein [Thermoanaerobaculia bacterium]
MRDVFFVLSTGRCGTQALASWIEAGAAGRAVITHEPILREYQPRKRATDGDVNDELPEAAEEHLQWIESVTREQPYIECGHPVWSTIPHLLRRFAGRIHILHLVRHPIPTAFSWITHQAYAPPYAAHIPTKILIDPFDRAARHHEYRERWAALPPHEKALYYWLEVNDLGLHLAKTSDAPWLTVRFEDFVAGRESAQLAEFFGIDAPPAAAPPNVDRFRYISDIQWNPEHVHEHPEVVRVAQALGYDVDDYDSRAIAQRYIAK